MFKAELVLHSVCQKLSTLCLRLLRTQKLNSLLKIFHSAVKAPWVSKPRSGLRPLFTQVTSLPTVMPAKAGDCVPYLPTGFITESVALCRNTLIGKQPAKAGISHTRTRMAAFVKSLKVCHSTVKAPWVRKPRSGFSLAEVLVVGVVGSVILAGSLQSLSVTVQSSQVIRSSLVEKDFVKSVGKIVSAPALCKANFKPATGKINKTHGTGTITTLTNKVCKYEVSGCTDTSENKEYPYSPLTTCKVASDCPEPSHTCTGGGSPTTTKKCVGAISITSEDDTSTPNVKEYEFKNALEIISLELTADEDPAEPPKGADKIRTFSVFYKKLGMGQLTELIPGQCARKTGTVSAKTDGCYSHQCKIRYKLNDAGTAVLTCEALDCIEEGMYECSGGMVRNADNTACICPAHTPNWDGSNCIDCEATDATKPWWNGARCDECPPNLIFKPDKRMCEACSAPTPKPNRATNKCEVCPDASSPWWNNGTCKPCPSNIPKYKSSTNECLTCHSVDPNNPAWDSRTNDCKTCSEVYPNPLKPAWDGDSCEPCSVVHTNPLKPAWDGDSCEPCPSNKIWIGGSCQCPTNNPKWHNNTCKSCQAFNNATPKWNGSRCVTCHAFNSSTPKWNGSRCVTCHTFNSSTPKWNGSRCVACPPSSPTWNGSSCVPRVNQCPEDWKYLVGSSCRPKCTGIFSGGRMTKWNGSNCVACPTERPNYYGNNNTCRACPSHSPVWHNKDCRRCYTANPRKPKWHNNTCKSCPAFNPSTPLWDGGLNRGFGDCRACRLQTPVWNSRERRCEGCPNSRPNWNSNTNTCVSRCPNSTRPPFHTHTFWNRNTNTCVTCPDDTPAWDKTTNTCKPCHDIPGPLLPVWNSFKRSCGPCPYNSRPIWSISQERCITCRDAFPTKPYNSSGTCVASCPTSHPYIDSRNRCKACHLYFRNPLKPVWNSSMRRCEACPYGTTWHYNSNTGGRCVGTPLNPSPCSSNERWINGQCINPK